MLQYHYKSIGTERNMMSRLILTLGTCLVVYHSKNVSMDEGVEALDDKGRLKGHTPGYYNYDSLEAYEDVIGVEEQDLLQPKGSL